MAQPQATQSGATTASSLGMEETGNSECGTVHVTNLGLLVAEAVVRSATTDLLSSVDDRIQAALANQGTGPKLSHLPTLPLRVQAPLQTSKE